MRFLVDAQLPPALARWLVSRGHEAVHVSDVGLLSAKDSEIWDEAVGRGAIIVTKDEDFAIRRSLRMDGPRIVWIRRGNVRTFVLLAYMETSINGIVAALDRGEAVVEVI